jgi:NTE family protein
MPKRADGQRSRAGRAAAGITLNLALQGGGAHGAFTWGALDRILESESVAFEGVSGASAGALNAVAFASGWLADGRAGARETLARLWGRIADKVPGSTMPTTALTQLAAPWGAQWSPTDMAVDMLTRMVSPYQFNPFDYNPLREILEQTIDFARLRAAAAPRIFIAATNVRSGRCRIFGNAELTADAVLASACLPHLNRAIEIEGEPYWDGGLTANPPILPLVEHCRSPHILLIQITPATAEESPTTAPGIGRRLSEIVFNAPLSREIDMLAMGTRIARDGIAFGGRMRRKLTSLKLHSIDATEALRLPGAASQIFPHWSMLSQLRDRGRAAAADWLAQEALPEKDKPAKRRPAEGATNHK